MILSQTISENSLKNHYLDKMDIEMTNKQNHWSILLILGIMCMVFLNLVCTPIDENDVLLTLALINPFMSVMLGGYVFTYRGKSHRLSKVFLIIFLLLTAVFTGGYLYLIDLAKAYSH